MPARGLLSEALEDILLALRLPPSCCRNALANAVRERLVGNELCLSDREGTSPTADTLSVKPMGGVQERLTPVIEPLLEPDASALDKR